MKTRISQCLSDRLLAYPGKPGNVNQVIGMHEVELRFRGFGRPILISLVFGVDQADERSHPATSSQP